MAAVRLPRAPALLLLILLGTSADLTQVNTAAARAEPLIPDSATGAGAEWEPWPEAVLPQLPARPVGPMPTMAPTTPAPTTLEPAPPRPDRPELVPRVVPVGDLALQDQTPAFDDGAPQPLEPLHYPLAVGATEQDPWGWRFSTTRGAWRMHTGLDLIVPGGTPVLAVLPGRVQRVDDINGYGLTVLINHGAGWSSLYAHLLKADVKPGETVGGGQPLGLVGQSGNASTPHLHLELRQWQPRGLVAVDPTPLLPEAPTSVSIAGDIRH